MPYVVLLARLAAGGVRRGSYCGGFRFAKTPLRCSGVGRAAELATRCALRSDSRSEHVTVRAFSAPTLPPALLAAAEIAPPHTARREPWARDRHQWFANTASTKPRLGAHRSGGASGTPSSAGVSVGARERASCSDSPHLSERSAQRVASCAVRPNPEQHRGVAAGDRSSEAPRPVCAQVWLCRAVQRAMTYKTTTRQRTCY